MRCIDVSKKCGPSFGKAVTKAQWCETFVVVVNCAKFQKCRLYYVKWNSMDRKVGASISLGNPKANP